MEEEDSEDERAWDIREKVEEWENVSMWWRAVKYEYEQRSSTTEKLRATMLNEWDTSTLTNRAPRLTAENFTLSLLPGPTWVIGKNIYIWLISLQFLKVVQDVNTHRRNHENFFY